MTDDRRPATDDRSRAAAHRMTRPGGTRDARFHRVEAEVGAAAQLGDVHDLSRVHAEVLDGVIDGLERGHAAALHRPPVVEPRRIGPRYHRVLLEHRLGENGQQLVAREGLPPAELARAVATIRRAAHAAHDPLPDVSRQVEHQVADAVRGVIGPPPEVRLGEALYRRGELGEVVGREVLAGLSQKGSAGFHAWAPTRKPTLPFWLN